ncbi:Midasin [Spathaspora sp. JA1]|nr:Midasin [Spathaspora sp. JA1]
MNNQVTLSLDDCELLHGEYKKQFPLKKLPNSFKFNKSITINENLNKLATLALDSTLVNYYCYKPIFLELIARWIEHTHEFENNNAIKGSVVLLSLSKLLGICHEHLNLFEYFLNKVDFFGVLEKSEQPVSASELEAILLAFYRSLKVDTHRFKSFVKPKVLYKILTLDSSYNVGKYLAIQIICIYLQASETSKNKMIHSHIGQDQPLLSQYEGDIVDFSFISLLEAKRISNYLNLPKLSGNGGNVLTIPSQELSSMITSVCGVLIPKLLLEQNSTTSQPSTSVFVPTQSSVDVLRKLAENIQINKPVMLYGKAGAGKTFLINQLANFMSYNDSLVKIHLGEQTDAKLLLGTYASGDKPGTFEWRTGVLTSAVEQGKWVFIEDIDKAPTEVLSVLLTLLEKRELSIPSRGEVIKAKNGFQLFSTIRTDDTDTIPDLIGMRLWELLKVEVPHEVDLKSILITKYPLLSRLIVAFIKCFNEITRIYSLGSFISLNKGSHPRIISFRDLMKFCGRCNNMLISQGITQQDQLLESVVYDNIFAEAIDCFGSALTEQAALEPLINIIGECLEIPTSRIQLFLKKHVPLFINDEDTLRIGRAVLKKEKSTLKSSKSGNNFARTNHSLRLMEQIGVAIDMIEPILLVGETGTGKTTVVQQVAKLMNKKLTVINVSQQTEAGDLLGGYKPVNTKTIAIPIQESFETIFIATFSEKKNEKFSKVLSKCFNKSQWKNVIRLWREALKMAKDILAEQEQPEEDKPRKKRMLNSFEKSILLEKWHEFETTIAQFEIQCASLDSSFVFNFVEGTLVKAVRNGDWLLLDELNLATSDTLESIADLLADTSDQRSILLTEKGDVESIKAHPEFRIFGCMNPSTDIGKKDLPLSIRSRFTEIYVHSPDQDIQDLLAIIDKYIARYAVGDEWVGNDIAELYLQAKSLSDTNKIVDGANQKPHFSIRTLTRTLVYVCDIVSIYGLRRSLYEGFSMSFLTLLDKKSEDLLKPLIIKYTIGRLKNVNSVMKQTPPAPTSSEYVQFKHYWMKRGPEEIVPQPQYIITPFVEKNMLNLVRATSGRRFPVLIQGPTSTGKTSMIHYLASITGHKFVRINNHEHTDLQEYLGTYVSNPTTGKLVFKEGVLVEALRKGHWIVLDELNLAPTDVLEALNRLLDDNRELFIPETQEIVHPHPDFMLFATQNPPGLYGGRKLLSRAFRNRFLELHYDDIPQDELEIILRERCQIAPSYCAKIVEVYRQLSVQRQSSRFMEQKNSFATLRDLFRWALRDAVGYEELAANGYMILAERVRKDDEKEIVKQTIEKVMKVKLDMDQYYKNLENESLFTSDSTIVWTKAMRRLAVLVSTCIKYNEPLLLVGETGCGKTSVCQVLAKYLTKELIIVNAHQNTETGDLLGAQRPVRHKVEIQSNLIKDLLELFKLMNVDTPENFTLDALLTIYNGLSIPEEYSELASRINSGKKNSNVLFEWCDGPLIRGMKQGDFFLLDEISLADDSVLERLNSVLEPERSLLLAEKGGSDEDSFITANPGFQFLATMNPGGDYGKKELSPALRNRFTEIWVPSMEDFEDVKQIVDSKVKYSQLTIPIVEFSQWFANKFGGANNGTISLRDILAWIDFINSSGGDNPYPGLFHGASMVFIDALGTNNTGYLSENETRLQQIKQECIDQLSKFVNHDLQQYNSQEYQVTSQDSKLTAGGYFSIPIIDNSNHSSFNLQAPTTALNAMRVIRAMQVRKPILLEGSPGVGKTSLITALASATGNPLIRINLSEQTDLVDLFGSDSPVEGGKPGEFMWRDAPFLRAMQRGEWVLLDEMNLASQSVLEGLNACLDHRGEAYIPELDKSFKRHEKFMVFAAQNPQVQGGGRKGLPKSFINRFTVVYVDTLKSYDLNLISQHLNPTVDPEECDKLIQFMSKLEQEVIIEKTWGNFGSPWEFNLRDTLRWLDLYTSKNLNQDISMGDFLDMIIVQRFRTKTDRERAQLLFQSIFTSLSNQDNYFQISESYIQSGGSLISRTPVISNVSADNLLPLQCNFTILETIFRCINNNIPLILTGATNSGKTDLIRFAANIVGAKLQEFSMNSDVDSMDILGGYEQVDLSRQLNGLICNVASVVTDLVVNNLVVESNSEMLVKSLELLEYIEKGDITSENFTLFYLLVVDYSKLCSISIVDDLVTQADALLIKIKNQQETRVKFEWFDGLLVQAVEQGNWLVLDNANLCSPSVLDRLNSLLETNGSLIINECSLPDGSPRVIVPHPNFRLFLTVDPRYAELSRAMRNRGIEVYLEDLPSRASVFDKKLLGMDSVVPTSRFDFSKDTGVYPFSLIDDVKREGEVTFSSLSSMIPLCDVNLVDKWSGIVQSSSEFSEDVKETGEEVGVKMKFFYNSLLYGKICELYEKSGEVSTEIIGKNIAKFQSPNPLINSYIVSSIKANISSSEPTMLYEVISGILSMETQLNKVEQNARDKKIHELTYLEKSTAVVVHGRNIKTPPRLAIYKFIKQVYDFIVAKFLSSIEQELFGDVVYTPLYELILIWNNMVIASQVQVSNEAELRVYQELIIKWSEEYSTDEQLTLAIKSFGNDLVLTTGVSMNKIWEFTRANYPPTLQAWKYMTRLTSLMNDFDLVAREQFIESKGAVGDLGSFIIDFYKSIIEGSFEDSQIEDIFGKLEQGISELKLVSESFLHKRKNNYAEEFTHICNFIESGGANQDLVQLYPFTNKSITSLINNKPYPKIFDSLWYMENNESNSRIPGLFTNELITSLLTKSLQINSTSGNVLEQTYSDVKEISNVVVKYSNSILQDQIQVFNKLLVSWFTQILQAHEVEVDITELTSDSLVGLPQEVVGIFEKYLLPSLVISSQAMDLPSLGKAWIMFSCGLIQLYVPSSPYDPAITEYVVFKMYQDQKKFAETLVSSWENVRQVTSGDYKKLVETKLDFNLEVPNKPKVYRDSTSVDNLFGEWQSFMDSSISVEPVESLYDSARELSEMSRKMMQIFQNNSSQFMMRLHLNYPVYSDLNDILCGYIFGLKLGFELMACEKGESEYPQDWSINVGEFTKADSLVKTFPLVKQFVKNLSVDSLVVEYIMTFFMKLSFIHPDQEDVFSDVLQTLYYRWSVRRIKQEKEDVQKGSLYKYVDPEDDIDGDFKKLFPDFEDVMTIEGGITKSNETFEDIYQGIAMVYIKQFLDDAKPNLNELVEQGSDLILQLSKYNLSKGTNNSSILTSLVNSLARQFKQNSEFNFYQDSNIEQVKIAIGVISDVYRLTTKLLNQWPEHETLRNIKFTTNELLNYPIGLPLGRYLQKLEQIYTYIGEWQKYASSQVSLQDQFNQLTNLIVSWRKLELTTWNSLFKFEEQAMEKTIGKWWFYLFEVIILPLMNDEQSDTTSILSALNVFMSKVTYGEFNIRLNLLNAFRNHAKSISKTDPIVDALTNFIDFYKQFQPIITVKIDETKKKLSKDISEVILLASWKDVNIDALKQSARKSHNNLYKIVRKYRALLATSITSIIEQGISADVKSSVSFVQLPTLQAHVQSERVLDQCNTISTWQGRPKRLQDISILDKNMKVYIERITSESMPNLYEYAKEIVEQMERLRTETPTTLTKDNKKLVANLKTQKRLLLSDTLKEIRQSGVKLRLRNNLQNSINVILTNTVSFKGSLVEGSDVHYFRILDLLPRLRASVGNCSPDVPQVDIEKGLYAVENLLDNSINVRNPLMTLANNITSLTESYTSFGEIANLNGELLSMSQSRVFTIENINKVLYWLPKLLDYAIHTIQSVNSFGITVPADVFYNSKLKLQELAQYKINLDVLTSETDKFIQDFTMYYIKLTEELVTWSTNNPTVSFIAAVVLDWTNYQPIPSIESNEITSNTTIQDIELEFRNLSTSIILAIQRVIEVQAELITEDDDNWFISTQQRLIQYTKQLRVNILAKKVSTCIKTISQLNHTGETSSLVSALASFTYPLLDHYYNLTLQVFNKFRSNYHDTSRATFILATSLHTLATKGFCSPEPPSEEKQDDNLQEGTGLGEGQAENNASNDVGDDEDLTEDAQQPNEEKKDRDEEDDENDDAVDIEGDMAGELEEASDQEGDDDEDKEEEDLDEEVDDIDDLDPNAIDEKMWDEEVKEDKKEKDSDKVPENSNKDDNMEANEEEQEGENNQEGQQDDNKEEQEEDAEDGEDKDVGEQEDEVKNQENEQLEDHVPESEVLDLPEDMNLDGDDEEVKEEEEEEDFDDKLNDMMEEDKDDKKEQEEEAGEEEDVEEVNEEADAEMDEEMEPEEQEQKPEGENDINEETMESDEELLNKDQEEDQEEQGKDETEQPAEGVEGANDIDNNEDIDMDSAVKQETGDRGEGADTQVMEENEDIGASGAASQPQQPQEQTKESMDDAREKANESLKQLGDSLKEFHRRRQEILEAKQDENVEEAANQRPDEFEHVEGENADFDTQALGAADKDQIQSIDEDKAIDDDMEEIEQEQPQEQDQVEVTEEVKPEESNQDVEPIEETPDADFESKSKNAFIGERKSDKDEDQLMFDREELPEPEQDVYNMEEIKHELDQTNPPLPLDQARELWKQSELATQELASGLCEQLRLILEPTLATKLKGDYKTGKRLNMKRIIPYIASDFKKDKIWLRRTKPSKRQYQIMIAVDDSKSMSESKSTELAFHSMALVSKALTQLESGGLSIVRFGEDIKVVHPFDKPFNQETGAKIFQWFDFQQTSTNMRQLCHQSLQIFEQARASSSSDLWQLQIILSDGVCEDHETILGMVRRAREEKIMMVFVVIDGINSKESILDMSQVSYVPDPNTGAMTLKVDKYLDTFPFEFYVVVRNINQLPEMLSLILRQYFSEISSL